MILQIGERLQIIDGRLIHRRQECEVGDIAAHFIGCALFAQRIHFVAVQ